MLFSICSDFGSNFGFVLVAEVKLPSAIIENWSLTTKKKKKMVNLICGFVFSCQESARKIVIWWYGPKWLQIKNNLDGLDCYQNGVSLYVYIF